MVLNYTVRIEMESGPVEKDFPSRERAELFLGLAADRGLAGIVIQHDADAVSHDRRLTSSSTDVHVERRGG